MQRQRGNSLMSKLAGKPKYHDQHGNRQWIHAAKSLTDGNVVYQAKYLGFTEVSEPKGAYVVKEAIKKIQIAHELRKSEAGKKGSKLQKVELHISIDAVKIVDLKTKEIIAQKPLHRISYCADDHTDKKIFAFIAKEQQIKSHHCFVVVTEKDAAELTVTVGQAFELAYKRYMEKTKREPQESKEVLELRQQVERAAAENLKLKQQLETKDNQPMPPQPTGNNFVPMSHNQQLPQANPNQVKAQEPSLLVDWGGTETATTATAPQNEPFDPFDNYLSKLAISREIGEPEPADPLYDRAPFQSPVQKNPSVENPFNPFDAFYSRDEEAATTNEIQYNGHVSEPSLYPSSVSRGMAPQGLPPPPTKQSIKAANAGKFKAGKQPSIEQFSGPTNEVNKDSVLIPDPFAVDFFN